MELDIGGIYAPNSNQPLLISDAKLDIYTRKVWLRDPNIYGFGEDNKFTTPPDITIELSLHDYDGNTYKTTLRTPEITINNKTDEPE